MKKLSAVFTICRNENVYLPIWLRYYSQFFGPDDMYVLDHETSDGSTDNLPCQKIRLTNPVWSVAWGKEQVSNMQRHLLEKYELVLFAEIDEFVVPFPAKYGNLSGYIRQFKGDVVSCMGIEIVHKRDNEPPVDFSKPILAQRKYYHLAVEYCKPLLSRIPLTWADGFHQAKEPSKIDSDLLLLHLHRVDYDYCRRRHGLTAAYAYDSDDIENNRGWQNRLKEGEAFDQWFDTLWGDPQPQNGLRQLPEWVRQAV